MDSALLSYVSNAAISKYIVAAGRRGEIVSFFLVVSQERKTQLSVSLEAPRFGYAIYRIARTLPFFFLGCSIYLTLISRASAFPLPYWW